MLRVVGMAADDTVSPIAARGLKHLAIAEIGQVVESVQTVDTVMSLATKHHVELPITALVQRVLREELSPAEAMRALLSREQKPEYPLPA